jgi:hypothetical protein
LKIECTIFDAYIKYGQAQYEKDILQKIKMPGMLSNQHSPNLINDEIKIVTSKKIVIS